MNSTNLKALVEKVKWCPLVLSDNQTGQTMRWFSLAGTEVAQRNLPLPHGPLVITCEHVQGGSNNESYTLRYKIVSTATAKESKSIYIEGVKDNTLPSNTRKALIEGIKKLAEEGASQLYMYTIKVESE
jgi:hypothetical protein